MSLQNSRYAIPSTVNACATLSFRSAKGCTAKLKSSDVNAKSVSFIWAFVATAVGGAVAQVSTAPPTLL